MSEQKKGVFALLTVENIKQFISYFFVGGISALVEWAVFGLLGRFFDMQYLAATGIAFIFSTTTNWILGRTFTFKKSRLGEKKFKEMVLVFGVSGIGLLMNLGLMYLFVTVLGMESELLKLLAKILATGIVFLWNFLSRKFLIYK